MPLIMPNEQGQKRLLSPESITTTEDKRRRNGSIEIIDFDSQIETTMAEPAPSVSDLKNSMDTMMASLALTANKEDIKHLATKGDFKIMDDRITAQGTEISQLRSEVKTLQENMVTLQSNVDSQFANSFARTVRSLGHEPGRSTNNMAAREANRAGTARHRDETWSLRASQATTNKK